MDSQPFSAPPIRSIQREVFQYTTGVARRWVLGLTGVASVFPLAIAFPLLHAAFAGDLGEGPWAIPLGMSVTLVLLGFSAASGACAYVTWRGPRPSTLSLRSGDPLLLACLTAVTLVLATFVFGALNSFANGEVREPLAAKIMLWLLTPLALVFALGTLKVAWNLVHYGRSGLELLEPPRVGETLRAALEIPFASHSAPAVEARVELHRMERLSADDPPDQIIAWTVCRRLDLWEPAGARCSRASLAIDLDLPIPDDIHQENVTYAWSLLLEPVAGDLGWNAHFDLPIAWEPRIA